jgi:hypothetical protein
MNRDVTLEEFDRAESPPLELSRASLWAHVAPPTGEHKPARTLLRQNSIAGALAKIIGYPPLLLAHPNALA